MFVCKCTRHDGARPGRRLWRVYILVSPKVGAVYVTLIMSWDEEESKKAVCILANKSKKVSIVVLAELSRFNS